MDKYSAVDFYLSLFLLSDVCNTAVWNEEGLGRVSGS